MSIYNRKDKGAAWLILFLASILLAFLGLTDSLGFISSSANYWIGGIALVHLAVMVGGLFNTKKGA